MRRRRHPAIGTSTIFTGKVRRRRKRVRPPLTQRSLPPTSPNLVEQDATWRSPPAWLAWSVWGVAALFYLSGFYQRVSPAVMTSELMHSFGISAKDLGNLSAFYFYTYVAMQ